MIASYSTCSNGRTLANYLERGQGRNAVEDPADRVDWSAGRNLVCCDDGRSATAAEVAREMRDEVRKGQYAENPYAHIIISWKRLTAEEEEAGTFAFSQANDQGAIGSDEPTKAEMLDVADRVIERLALSNHQVWMVSHKDTDTPHLHLLINRFNFETERFNSLWRCQQKMAEVFREVEKERGWATPKRGIELAEKGYISSRRRNALKIRARQWEDFGGDGPFATPEGEETIGRRTASNYTLREAIDVALGTELRQVRSWEQLEKTLAARALWLTPRKSGFVINGGEHQVALSTLATPVSRRLWERLFGQSWNAYAGTETFEKSYAQDAAGSVDYINEREGDFLAVKWADFEEEIELHSSDFPPHLAPALDAPLQHSPPPSFSSPSSQPQSPMETGPENASDSGPSGDGILGTGYTHFSEVPRDIRIELRARVDNALRGDVTATEFFDRLESDGEVRVRPVQNEETGSIEELMYELRGEQVEGHLLGKHYTWKGVSSTPGFSFAEEDRTRVYQTLGIPQGEARRLAGQQAAEEALAGTAQEEAEQGGDQDPADPEQADAAPGAEDAFGESGHEEEASDRPEGSATNQADVDDRQPYYPDLPAELYSRLAMAREDMLAAMETGYRSHFLEAASRNGLLANLTGGDDVHFTVAGEDLEESVHGRSGTTLAPRQAIADKTPLPQATLSGSQLIENYRIGFGQDARRFSPSDPAERALEFAAGYYRSVYDRLDESHPAKRYVRAAQSEGGRGFDTDTERAFEVGYAPDNWRAFYRAAVSEGFSPEVLERAGLVQLRQDIEKLGMAVSKAANELKEAEEGSKEAEEASKKLEEAQKNLDAELQLRVGQEFVDCFRARIVLPVRSENGNVAGFGARRVPGMDTDVATGDGKYRNSAKSEYFQKRREIFGRAALQQAFAKNKTDENEVIIVEGFLDAMKLHQKGFKNVVAGMGMNFSPEHGGVVARLGATHAVVLFDGGKNEESKALAAMSRLEERGISTDAVLLPEGTDPDDLVSSEGGPEKLRELLDSERVSTVEMVFRTEERREGPDVIRASEAMRQVALILNGARDAPARVQEKLVSDLASERERAFPGQYESDEGRQDAMRNTRRTVARHLRREHGFTEDEIRFTVDEAQDDRRPQPSVEGEAADWDAQQAGQEGELSEADAVATYESLFGRPVLDKRPAQAKEPVEEPMESKEPGQPQSEEDPEATAEEATSDLPGESAGFTSEAEASPELQQARDELASKKRSLANYTSSARKTLRLERRLETVEKAIEQVSGLTSKKEVQALHQRAGQSRRRLRRQLARVYSRPDRALSRLEQLSRRHGPKQALEGLQREPQRLGTLRGHAAHAWKAPFRPARPMEEQAAADAAASGEMREHASSYLALEAAERAAENARLSSEAEQVSLDLRESSKAAMLRAIDESYPEPRQAYSAMQRALRSGHFDEETIAASLERTPETFGPLRGEDGTGERLRAEVAAEQAAYHLRQFTAHVHRIDEHRDAIGFAEEARDTHLDLLGEDSPDFDSTASRSEGNEGEGQEESTGETNSLPTAEREPLSSAGRAVLVCLQNEVETLKKELVAQPPLRMTEARLETLTEEIQYYEERVEELEAAPDQSPADQNEPGKESEKAPASATANETDKEEDESKNRAQGREDPTPSLGGFGGRDREEDFGPGL